MSAQERMMIEMREKLEMIFVNKASMPVEMKLERMSLGELLYYVLVERREAAEMLEA